MPDDLLTTVKAALNGYARHGFYSMNFQPHEALSALLARCEAAEGCDGNCSCVVMSRHEWQRAYSEERLKREAVEAAFREGWTWLEPYCESADGAWLASEARRKVGI